MPKFLKNKRNLFALGCILFVLLTICIIVIFIVIRNIQIHSTQPTDISQIPPVKPPTKAPDDVTPPVPPKTPITLKYPERFTKAIYEDEGCGHQSGLVTYTYAVDPESRVGQLVISNKNLPMDSQQKQDFQDALDVINGVKTVIYGSTPGTDQLGGLPLEATYAECGGAAYYPAETFNVNYPGVEKAVAIMTLGGFQSYFDHISDVDMTLWIYARKGDEIAQESLRFKAGEVFTDAEANICMTTTDGSEPYIDPQCVVDNAKGSVLKLNIYKAKAADLMNTFALNE